MLAALNHKFDLGECWHSLKWESRFTLELNTAKSIDYIEKCFVRKLRRIKFPMKNWVEAYLYLSQEWSWGAAKICQLWNTVTHWNGKISSLWNWKLQKNINYIKKCFEQKLHRYKFPTKKPMQEWRYGAPVIWHCDFISSSIWKRTYTS